MRDGDSFPVIFLCFDLPFKPFKSCRVKKLFFSIIVQFFNWVGNSQVLSELSEFSQEFVYAHATLRKFYGKTKTSNFFRQMETGNVNENKTQEINLKSFLALSKRGNSWIRKEPWNVNTENVQQFWNFPLFRLFSHWQQIVRKVRKTEWKRENFESTVLRWLKLHPGNAKSKSSLIVNHCRCFLVKRIQKTWSSSEKFTTVIMLKKYLKWNWNEPFK